MNRINHLDTTTARGNKSIDIRGKYRFRHGYRQSSLKHTNFLKHTNKHPLR